MSHVVESLIDWDPDASNDRTGWIKFGVGYCFPSKLSIDQSLFSPSVYENLTRNPEKRMIFFSLFESINKLDITVRNYYWNFLPFELIFDKSGNNINGLHLQIDCATYKAESGAITTYEEYLQSISQFCQFYEKYAQTVDKRKMRKIRSIDVDGKTDHKSGYAKPYFQGWKMLYTSLIGATKKKRISNGYSDRYETLILSIDALCNTHSNHEAHNCNIHNNNYNNNRNNSNNNTNCGEICWCIARRGNYDGQTMKEQLDSIELNPKEIHLIMDMIIYDMIENRDDFTRYFTFYDQLLSICTGKIVLIAMVGNDEKTPDWYRYHYSNHFLSMLAKDAGQEEWQNLRKFIVSIRWRFILNKTSKSQLCSSQDKIQDSILTNPLVPLTSRKEFEYSHFKHKNLSCHTINTSSNFKYKSLGNILHNLTKRMESYCQANKDKPETL